jgi:ferredoxin
MRVIADTSVCQGHQLCQGEAPDVFGFDEDADVVEVLIVHPQESRRADVTMAVKYCPAFALSIEETPSMEEEVDV